MFEKGFLLFIWYSPACMPEVVCSCFLFTILMPLVSLQLSIIMSPSLKGLTVFNHSLDGSQSTASVSLGILLCMFTRFTNYLGIVDSSPPCGNLYWDFISSWNWKVNWEHPLIPRSSFRWCFGFVPVLRPMLWGGSFADFFKVSNIVPVPPVLISATPISLSVCIQPLWSSADPFTPSWVAPSQE